ncbi:MAG: class I SAM-dependent methyltransferase, partial [Allosphingosinicella sp.]
MKAPLILPIILGMAAAIAVAATAACAPAAGTASPPPIRDGAARAGLGGHAERFGRFDAVFSNAALHWMTDVEPVAAGVFAVLKEGGRFAGEMG